MRIIIPIVIIILGMLAGAAVCALFKQTVHGLKLSLISGAVGSFTGLVIRDALDITAGGPAMGALLAAISGAVCFSVLANIYLKWSHDG
ncbi:MAG: hypothetical protein AB8B63_10465 [Granulosicoccus sp.]